MPPWPSPALPGPSSLVGCICLSLNPQSSELINVFPRWARLTAGRCVEMDSLVNASRPRTHSLERLLHPSPSGKGKHQGSRIPEPSLKGSSQREGGWFLP